MAFQWSGQVFRQAALASASLGAPPLLSHCAGQTSQQTDDPLYKILLGQWSLHHITRSRQMKRVKDWEFTM